MRILEKIDDMQEGGEVFPFTPSFFIEG